MDNADNQYAPATDIEGTSRPQGTTSDIGAYEYNISAGTNEISITPNFSVFPVPTDAILFFEKELENVSVSVYNSAGICVIKQQKSATIQSLNVSQLLNGIYFIQLQTNDNQYIAKFIKKMIFKY